MNAIDFDPETHTYSVAGRRYPGVTGIIKRGGFMPDYAFADPTLGERVHKATEAYDRAHPFEAPLMGDSEIIEPFSLTEAGCLEQWIRFRREYCFIPDLIEHRVAHPILGYAGTVDRIGRYWRTDDDGKRRQYQVILDIKTGDPSPWHGLQLAGYAAAAGLDRNVVRFGVYLRENTYHVEEYFDPNDLTVFMGALAGQNWKERHGIA